ncbi:hypothetical protein [Scytonema sp. PRP1]|uniref:hypothetical protein n=1 Tax=Scytonema sp. PRP1 TaxID=3120513 RepID=UPI002FD54B6D
MLPEEDRQALKNNGYKISPKGVISPIAHPLQTHNRKSSSSAAQLGRQQERDSLNNSRPIQPKPTPTPTASNNRRYGSADAAERWTSGASPKPKPMPNLRGMSPDAAERWTSGASPKPKPTPNLRGMSPDAAERWTSGASPKPKPTPNLRGMSPDAAERWSKSSTPQPKPTPNLRGMSPDAAERWNGGSAIAPLGQQPAKDPPLPPPPASEPPKPEPEKSWWNKARDFVKEKTTDAWDKTKSAGTFVKDHAEDFGHGALDAAGFIPLAGAAFDGVHAAWYLAKGDKVNAALSAASAIPFAGDAFAAGKLATKGVIAAKGLKSVSEAKNLANVTEEVLNTAKVGGRGPRIKKNKGVGNLTEDLWNGHLNAEVKAGNLEVHIPQTTLKNPTTNKTMQLNGKRRVLDNYVKETSSGQGIALEIKATPRAAQSAKAKAQSSRTQAGINRGAVAGNKEDGYHKVDAQVTKVGLPILGSGGNTGPHLLDPPLDLPHLL